MADPLCARCGARWCCEGYTSGCRCCDEAITQPGPGLKRRKRAPRGTTGEQPAPEED